MTRHMIAAVILCVTLIFSNSALAENPFVPGTFCQLVQEAEHGDKAARRPAAGFAKTDDLTKHPQFKRFQQGSFIIQARVVNYRARGTTKSPKGKKTYFHEIQFEAIGQFKGDYLSRVENAMESAGLEKRSPIKVTSLYSSEKAGIVESATKSGSHCLLILEPVKASAMAGTVPVRIAGVFAATDEMTKVAQAAAEKKKDDKKKSDK